MKLNIDANASRPGGASTRAPRRGRSKLGKAMSEAWGALGGRKSEPDLQSPEELAQRARAQEQLARAKGILQLDRTLTAAEREARGLAPEPSAAGLQIAAWIAAEVEGLDDASLPLEPHDFERAPRPAAISLEASLTLEELALERLETATMPLHALPEPYDEAITATVDVRLAGRSDDDAGDQAPSAEAEPPLESTEIATGTARSAAGIDVLAQAGGQGEPIRTRTMARLLASHGYHDRALAIYEHLLAEQPDDEALRAEAATAREALAQKAG